MYVAVKGGEKAIDAAHALQESRRRGDTDLPELSVAQIEQQLNLAVDRVMTEGGIADRELAALALKQASGDNVEAIFLLRAYRTTLAKLAVSEPLDTTGMRLERRISAIYKDIPGGQLLGPTYDYTHRLLDFTLLANGETPTLTTADSEQQPSPHVFSLLARQGLAKFEEDSGAQPDDITRTPPVYPCSRSSRLQQLMRGDEGYLLALAYSTQRGYGRNHPFAGEKLSPVSGVQKAKDLDDAIDKMMACLEYQGKGHSCGIHTNDVEDVNKLAAVAPVTKCVVNQPQCLTNSGGWDCGFPVSMTLGCGTWGGNSVSHNATWKDLLNFTYVSRQIPNWKPEKAEDFIDADVIAKVDA